MNKEKWGLYLIVVSYVILWWLTHQNCYFWDNIQQTSIEAHWYFDKGFSEILLPANGTDDTYSSTGYHPPLIPLITAILWKLLGHEMWVSHGLALLSFSILIYNLNRLGNIFLTKSLSIWFTALVLFESTVLTQFSIASPDFFLLTAFVASIRFALTGSRIYFMLTNAILFSMNMRGLFTGGILMMSYLAYQFSIERKYSLNIWLKTLLPFLPALLILIVYYAYYFFSRGWFFDNSPYAEAYLPPHNLEVIIKNLFSFGLRMIENGRIMVYLWFIIMLRRCGIKKSFYHLKLQFPLIIFSGLFLLYFVFVFITHIPFASRYFIPIYTVLLLCTLFLAQQNMSSLNINRIAIIVLICHATGHFWIYPNKIAKSWDSTLAHLPFYSLRDSCLSFIDSNKIPYSEIGGGFSIYGHRRMIELNESQAVISPDDSRKYFLYSNICNVSDSLHDNLHFSQDWQVVSEYSQWPVELTLFQRR